MENKQKMLKYIGKMLIFVLLFCLSLTLVDINRPVRLSLQKVDAINIIGESKRIMVSDQEIIDKFIEQMKYKFVIPNSLSYEVQPLTKGEYVLAFFNKNKVVGIFSYNIEKKLLNPRGQPLSSELYDILESFIKEISSESNRSCTL